MRTLDTIPADGRCGRGALGATAAMAVRPFDVVLLEVVPAGEAPSLDRKLETLPASLVRLVRWPTPSTTMP
jgi:hypothetical protein